MGNEIEKLEEIYADNSDIRVRRIKAKRIIDVISKYDSKVKLRSCLEIGTGSGVMSEIFRGCFDSFVSVDLHDIRLGKNNIIGFIRASAEKLPFKDEQFEIIIFNHVYQYLRKKNISLSEISRVMKKNGFCYFTTSNRFALIEPHYSLPFLGYLPKYLAGLYLKIITGKYSEYNIYSEGYCSLLKRLNLYFNADDITLDLIKNYEKYDFSDLSGVEYLSKIPGKILNAFKISVFTSWIFILQSRQTK